MDDLVTRKDVVGSDLVKAVTVLMPGDSLEHILDTVRTITLKRVLGAVKSRQFSTVIHLVEHLKLTGLTVADVATLLTLMEDSEAVDPKLRESITSLRTSGLVSSVYDFIQEVEPAPKLNPPSCLCWR